VSVEYELKLGKRGGNDLCTLLQSWAQETGIDIDTAIAFREGELGACVLVPGASIRGFSVTSASHWLTLTLTVRINVCASSGDWRLLYSLLTFLLEREARGQHEDGTPLAIAELTAAASMEQWETHLRSGIRALQIVFQNDDSEFVRLPNHRFPISVGRNEVPRSSCSREDLERFQALLQMRLDRYWQARDASTIELADGRRMIVWVGDAMLLEGVDLVVIPEQVDGEPSRVLPWNVLPALAPNAVETIPGTPPVYYVRSFDAADERDAEIWKSLVDRSETLESLRHL
jgi:hypothetical protein